MSPCPAHFSSSCTASSLFGSKVPSKEPRFGTLPPKSSKAGKHKRKNINLSRAVPTNSKAGKRRCVVQPSFWAHAPTNSKAGKRRCVVQPGFWAHAHTNSKARQAQVCSATQLLGTCAYKQQGRQAQVCSATQLLGTCAYEQQGSQAQVCSATRLLGTCTYKQQGRQAQVCRTTRLFGTCAYKRQRQASTVGLLCACHLVHKHKCENVVRVWMITLVIWLMSFGHDTEAAVYLIAKLWAGYAKYNSPGFHAGDRSRLLISRGWLENASAKMSEHWDLCQLH